MQCLSCGREIGSSFGLCTECQTKKEASPKSESHASKVFAALQTVCSYFRADKRRLLFLSEAIFLPIVLYLFFKGIGVSFSNSNQFVRPPGLTAAEAPQQSAPLSPLKWEAHGWSFTPLATYNIRARVLMKASFTFGTLSSISPYDFALGWDKMSDTAILKQYTFTHMNRFVGWSSDLLPISYEESNRSACNLHALPGNNDVRKILDQIKVDDIVTFKGFLIRAEGAHGETWNSSLTREDTGAGACEIMWINSASFER